MPALSASLYLDVTFGSEYNDHTGCMSWCKQYSDCLCTLVLFRNSHFIEHLQLTNSKAGNLQTFSLLGDACLLPSQEFYRLIQDQEKWSPWS
jgi:hypothetical protein